MRRLSVVAVLLLPLAAFAANTAPANASAATFAMAAPALDAYVGSYELAPGFVLTISRRGEQLYAQATGQGAAPIYESAKDQFFYKVVNAQISFERDAAGNVTGLVLHQNGDHPAPRMASAASAVTAMAPASATNWIAAAAVGTTTLPITVTRDGFVLKGVLDLPAGKGPFGVVDIIPGSGPVSLNGNDGPITYSPYRKLAAALVEAGWAVARVAKRGMAPSTGNGNDVVFSDQLADNLAIVAALRKNPHINPRLIVVAGHSLGGLIAPKLATETKLAGLILLEAPGEAMSRISTSQALAMSRQAGASATKLKAIAAEQNQFYAAVAKAPPGQSVRFAGKTLQPDAVQLFKSWYAQKPLATAREVTIPVLVVQGGLDFNVPPGNGKRLVKALPHATLLLLPRMGHALDDADCRCVRQLDTGKDATLAPGLAAGIVRWLQAL
ncbi:MAG TPA: alpha/beta fold hydrolase [Gammaproteobacteria bacterium]|nr:alpha/beta fold hydrolase [Gammaproteobacteria bacterium]